MDNILKMHHQAKLVFSICFMEFKNQKQGGVLSGSGSKSIPSAPWEGLPLLTCTCFDILLFNMIDAQNDFIHYPVLAKICSDIPLGVSQKSSLKLSQ